MKRIIRIYILPITALLTAFFVSLFLMSEAITIPQEFQWLKIISAVSSLGYMAVTTMVTVLYIESRINSRRNPEDWME